MVPNKVSKEHGKTIMEWIAKKMDTNERWKWYYYMREDGPWLFNNNLGIYSFNWALNFWKKWYTLGKGLELGALIFWNTWCSLGKGFKLGALAQGIYVVMEIGLEK